MRNLLRSFPEVTIVASEHGRPDDGTDPTGFFNVEFYVGLKPYSEWKGPHRTKAELIAAIDEKLKAFPGIIFNYTQPAEDAVDEAETGLKSSLAVKVFGTDLQTLEAKGKAIKHVLENVRGITEVTLVQELGQPSLAIKIKRAKIARYGLNVADINGLIRAAVGGARRPRSCRARSSSIWWSGWKTGSATRRRKSATSSWPRPTASRSR